MNWTTIRAALVAWVAAGTGFDPTKQVQWRDGQRTMIAHPYATLFVRAPKANGIDAVNWTFDGTAPAGHEMTAQVRGNREFTCQVELRSRDARAGDDALAFAEKLRTSLRRPSVLAPLQAAGLAVIRALPLTDISEGWDNRFEGRVLLEVAFSTASNVSDSNPTGYIEHAEVASDFTGTTEQIDETLPPLP